MAKKEMTKQDAWKILSEACQSMRLSWKEHQVLILALQLLKPEESDNKVGQEVKE